MAYHPSHQRITGNPWALQYPVRVLTVDRATKVAKITALVTLAVHDSVLKNGPCKLRGESKNHALVVIEDLKVRNMSRSASGTVEAPGKCVRAKSSLNKSILDQGWYEFRRQLAYKLAWLGGTLLAIPPQYTSQKCSRCGCVDKKNRPSQARCKCTACGFECNADYNAALNILAAGHAVSACGAGRV